MTRQSPKIVAVCEFAVLAKKEHNILVDLDENQYYICSLSAARRLRVLLLLLT